MMKNNGWILPLKCTKCIRETYLHDHWRCRCFDPVERINALAEKHATVNKDNMPLWMTFMHYGKKFSYIHAADIVMEELDK